MFDFAEIWRYAQSHWPVEKKSRLKVQNRWHRTLVRHSIYFSGCSRNGLPGPYSHLASVFGKYFGCNGFEPPINGPDGLKQDLDRLCPCLDKSLAGGGPTPPSTSPYTAMKWKRILRIVHHKQCYILNGVTRTAIVWDAPRPLDNVEFELNLFLIWTTMRQVTLTNQMTDGGAPVRLS